MVNEKRQQLVDTALKLFYRHGVHALGINQVLQESGIAKKTLYHHFSGKDELIEACLVERDTRFMKWFMGECSQASSLNGFIHALFNALDNWINNRAPQLENFHGCFFVNVSAEFNDASSKINQLCKQHKEHVKAFILERLQVFMANLKQKNELAELLLLLKEGCINSAHVMGDKEAAIKAQALAISYSQITFNEG